MIIVENLIQGSEEWLKEKLGKVSASNAEKIITSTGKKSTQREGYLYTLAAEIVRGESDESYKNGHMETGNEREEESRDYYSLTTGEDIKQVGVIYKDESQRVLCSPDGVNLELEKGLELKNVLGKTQVDYLLKNQVPTKYVMQIQFSLWVTGFKRWAFCSYCPGMKVLIVPVEPDEKIQELLNEAVPEFVSDLDKTVKAIS